jgi:prefoldin subunit 5
MAEVSQRTLQELIEESKRLREQSEALQRRMAELDERLATVADRPRQTGAAHLPPPLPTANS